MADRGVSQTILLTIDALRVDNLSQYGYERETMPALDRLDSQGTRYEAAFANGTNTGVSLPSLLSSRYRGTQPCVRGPTIATALQNAGIRTAGFHSNTLFASIVGQAAGFDDFHDFGVTEETSDSDRASLSRKIYTKTVDKAKPFVERLGIKPVAKQVRDALLPADILHSMTYYIDAEELTDAVVAWLREHSDEPFFLWVHYLDPHRPYGIDLQNPAYCEPADTEEIRNLMSKAGVTPESVTETERRRMIDLYDSDLRYTSREIDRLFNELEDLGIWDETAIVCTADHGEEFGEHGNFFHRNRPYDELIHVPLFVKAPKFDDETITQPRELLDISPTICEIMDVDCPPSFRGIPLDCSETRQIIATGSFAESGPVVAGRWEDWKYISTETEEELYNLSNDSLEQENVVTAHPDVASRYREAIPDDLYEDSQVSVDQAENEEVEERLRGLGYLE